MTWVRHSDDFSSHPKVVGLSDKAYRLHFCALEHAARHLTDGVITQLSLRSAALAAGIARPKAVAISLLRAGLWEKYRDDSYLIHDYLDYNASAATIKAERKKAAERMQRVRGERSAELPPERSGTPSIPILKEHPPTPLKGGSATRNGPNPKPTKRDLARFTGCKLTRGSHGTGWKRTPLGTDQPPKDWPYPKPTEPEILEALAAGRDRLTQPEPT